MQQWTREAAGAVRRMWGWLVLSAVLLLLIHATAPQQVEVIVYKTALVTLAAALAYLVDRSLYRRLRGINTAMPQDMLSAARVLARAIVLLAIVVGITGGI